MNRPDDDTRRTAAYWNRDLLGTRAPECGPGDHAMAKVFLRKIEAAIDHGGWTKSEWRNLHRLHEVWSRRARGTVH